MFESADSAKPRPRRLWPFNDQIEWGPTLAHAIPTTLVILGLFYYWFAIADRYAVFLYEHLGATPSDAVTSSRYWMAGLVASSMVMIGHITVNWLLGRIAALGHRYYCPPAWGHVWALCAVPLVIGIPLITMTLNSPTLPPHLAAACVVVTLIGLALALSPASWAAERPLDLVWLVFDGFGLMPTLLLLRVVELPSRGLVSTPIVWLGALGGTLGGMFWLGIMTGLRIWRRKPTPEGSCLLASGLCLSYLGMPLAHHLFFTPVGYRYISTSTNFFASNPLLQLVVFGVAALLAFGVARLRERLPQPLEALSRHLGEPWEN